MSNVLHKFYMVSRLSDGTYELEELVERHSEESRGSFSFEMKQSEPVNDRERFDQLLEAALSASHRMGGLTVSWVYNKVRVDTGEEHRFGAWAAYTELNQEMAN